MTAPYPILEFDPTETAVVDPRRVIEPINLSTRCVLCFFQDVIAEQLAAGRLREVYQLGSEIGHNPVYLLEEQGEPLLVCHPGVGAPLAAGFMEELIALGCTQFIACGGCGVLDGAVGLGQVVVLETAVRDEGTSYHYLPPAREVAASPAAVAAIEQAVRQHHLPYVRGKTWTTDGIYRETPGKVAQRRAEGCIVVEMETAAFCAVAHFRGVTFGQLVYGGDDLSGDEWDSRNWQKETSTRQKLFQLAVEACLIVNR